MVRRIIWDMSFRSAGRGKRRLELREPLWAAGVGGAGDWMKVLGRYQLPVILGM